MRIVINDANILIDLIHLEMVDVFFRLENLELRITDFVYEELHEEQKNILQPFVNSGDLILTESDQSDLVNISNLMNNSNGLSFQDCSVWYFAKFFEGILLTGDGRLRKQSSEDGVEVRGVLFVFDKLLIDGLINFEYAILKINQLYQINERLPMIAKIERLHSWTQSEHIT